jgi:hypothetical protein
LVERDVLENVRGEHLREYRVGVASVLDIMRGVRGHIAEPMSGSMPLMIS